MPRLRDLLINEARMREAGLDKLRAAQRPLQGTVTPDGIVVPGQEAPIPLPPGGGLPGEGTVVWWDGVAWREDQQAALSELRTVTLPALESDLEAAATAVSEVKNVTIPALQDDLNANTTAINTVKNVTIPALQDDLDANEGILNEVKNTTIPNLQGRLSSAETSISTTLPGAIQSAQQAADMALLIAPVSTSAPTTGDGSGRPVGAIWTRIDGSGNEIGYWRWTGSSWVSQALGTQVIPNLSASKITTGTLDTARLNASTVAAAVALVIELNASRITSGTVDTARLNAQEIAAAVATVIQLNADRITAGTINTNRLNASEIAVAVATIVQLNADRITAGTLNSDRLNATEIAARVATVISLNADRITAGTINTARLNASEVAAAVGNFLTINAGNLAATIVLASKLVAGSPSGARWELDSTGLVAYNSGSTPVMRMVDGNIEMSGTLRQTRTNTYGTWTLTAGQLTQNEVGFHIGGAGQTPGSNRGFFIATSQGVGGVAPRLYYYSAQDADRAEIYFRPSGLTAYVGNVTPGNVWNRALTFDQSGLQLDGRVIADKDTGWLTIGTFGSSWGAVAAQPPAVRYRDGTLHFRGAIEKGSGNSGFENAFALPAAITTAMRPSWQHIAASTGSGGVGAKLQQASAGSATINCFCPGTGYQLVPISALTVFVA